MSASDSGAGPVGAPRVVVEEMVPTDLAAVLAIYAEGIATGNATFETTVPAPETWEAAHIPAPRLIARLAGQLVGWAALSPVSSRPVYAGVAEVSVYVSASSRGQGVGKALLTRLVIESERLGFWTLQASIFPENVASVSLHRACGFREVGYRERIACLAGVWRDTILMEKRVAFGPQPQ